MIVTRRDAVLGQLDITPSLISYLDVRSLASFAKLNKLSAQFAKDRLASASWYIYVVGGVLTDGLGNKVERYSVAAGSWETLPPLPCACEDLSACVAEGQLYIFGLVEKEDDEDSSPWTPKCRHVFLAFDHERKRWEDLGAVPLMFGDWNAIHDEHSTIQTAVLNGCIYVLGSRPFECKAFVCQCGKACGCWTIARFHRNTGSWEMLPMWPSLSSGSDFKMVASNGSLFLIGGDDGRGTVRLDGKKVEPKFNFEMYDPEKDQWKELALTDADLRCAVERHSDGEVTTLGTKVFVSHIEQCDYYDEHSPRYVNDSFQWHFKEYLTHVCWWYDCASGTWTRGPVMPAIRNDVKLVPLGDIPYMIGGMDSREVYGLRTDSRRRNGMWHRYQPARFHKHRKYVSLGNGKALYAIGCEGLSSSGLSSERNVESFSPDGKAGSWRRHASLPSLGGEDIFAAVAVAIAGGLHGDVPAPGGSGEDADDAEEEAEDPEEEEEEEDEEESEEER